MRHVGIGALLGRQSESVLAALVSAVAARLPRDGGAHEQEPGEEPQE